MSTPLVTVVPHRMVRGLRVPTDGTTWDWRKIPGSAGNTARVVAGCRVLPIEEACGASWKSDALLMAPVAYRDGEATRVQPRLTKNTLRAVREAGWDVRCWALVADFDSVPKIPWDDSRQLAQLERVLGNEQFARGLWWFTARGLRLVQALREPIPVEQYEAIAEGWRAELLASGLTVEEFGLHLDPACRDWTRLQGLRDVVRPDGLFQRYPLGGRLVLRELPDATVTEAVARVRRAGKRIEAPGQFAETLAPRWVGRAQALAAAMLTIQVGWNDAFLCLSGALVQRGVPAGEVPAIIEAVSRATQNDSQTENRVTNARRTIDLAVRGEPIRGWDALLVGFPRLAETLERALVNLGASGEVLVPRDAAGQEIQEALRGAPDGVSGIEAGCGVGKTRAVQDVAIERAGSIGTRALDCRTTLSVPTNALAKQFAADVRRRGLPVLRLFSPPSEVTPSGEPVCKYAASARAIAGAGLSVPFEFCTGRGDRSRACEYLDECPAASGQEGDEGAKIVVGNHGMLSRLAKVTGKTGLLGIDEPASVLVTHRLERADLQRLRELSSAFGSWLAGIRPALETCEWWLSDMLPGQPVDLSAVVAEADATAAKSVPAQPQIRWGDMARARSNGTYATMLGQAGRCANILRTVWGSEARWVVWIEEREGDGQKVRALMLTGPDEQLVQVLRREGRTVLLDASLDARALSVAAGYDLATRITRVWARDGAPVSRTWLRWGAGARRSLIDEGELQLGVFASGLRHAIRWANEDPKCSRIGLFCIKPFRACLDAALARTRGADEREARGLLARWGVPQRYLSEIDSHLVPVLRAFAGEILPGHHGALRGLNDWLNVDATITLGDPWPHLLAARHEHAYFSGEGDSRSRWIAERELEQAHGRLRAPGLTRPARALHVGSVLPRGPGWTDAEYREVEGGRPRTDAAMPAEELRAWVQREHGGRLRQAARALEIGAETLRRYLLDSKGSRGIPPAVAARVRSVPETLNRDTPIKGFGDSSSPTKHEEEALASIRRTP